MEGARFDLGAHTLPYRSEPLERALRGIAAAGFKSVGLVSEHAGTPLVSEHPDPNEVVSLRRRIEDFGLTPVCLFARRGAMEQTERLIADLDLCATMGVPYLLGFGPWPDGPGGQRKPVMQWHGEVERFLAVLRAGGREAQRRGVTIVLKPHRGATSTGADLTDVLTRTDSPAVRCCWDAGNIRYYEGLDSEDDLERSGVAPLVSAVCIKDHAGGQWNNSFPIPGEGDVDHARMLRILASAGFRGPLLVERFDQPDAEANDAAMLRTRRFLESVIQSLDGGGHNPGGKQPA